MRLATWPASVCRRGKVCAAGLAMLLSLAAFLAPMDAMAMRRIDPGERGVVHKVCQRLRL